MSCIGLSQNSVLRPPLFSIYIHLLGDLIPYHCFKYCLHANSSFCPPFWSTSLNFRLVYTIQYLISLQGCLKLIVFKIEPPIFIHQIHSYDGLSILVHGRFIFPIAQEKTKSIIFSFAYTPHSIWQGIWFELPSEYVLDPATLPSSDYLSDMPDTSRFSHSGYCVVSLPLHLSYITGLSGQNNPGRPVGSLLYNTPKSSPLRAKAKVLKITDRILRHLASCPLPELSTDSSHLTYALCSGLTPNWLPCCSLILNSVPQTSTWRIPPPLSDLPLNVTFLGMM